MPRFAYTVEAAVECGDFDLVPPGRLCELIRGVLEHELLAGDPRWPRRARVEQVEAEVRKLPDDQEPRP